MYEIVPDHPARRLVTAANLHLSAGARQDAAYAVAALSAAVGSDPADTLVRLVRAACDSPDVLAAVAAAPPVPPTPHGLADRLTDAVTASVRSRLAGLPVGVSDEADDESDEAETNADGFPSIPIPTAGLSDRDRASLGMTESAAAPRAETPDPDTDEESYVAWLTAGEPAAVQVERDGHPVTFMACYDSQYENTDPAVVALPSMAIRDAVVKLTGWYAPDRNQRRRLSGDVPMVGKVALAAMLQDADAEELIPA